MTDVVSAAIVELAKYAVLAYAIKHGRDVAIHWLDTVQVQPPRPEQQILDTARTHGIDLARLAQEQGAP